jgi:putative copper resistance protein D
VLSALPAGEAAPTVVDVFSDWTFEAAVVVPLVVAAALYAWAMARVRRRHPARPWPAGRAASFAGGLATIAIATLSIVGRYDTTFFWIHMVQHLLLIMVAPALLILGRPMILAMHATRNPAHTAIKRILRSRVVTAITCPLVAIPLYAVVVVATHLTSFNNLVVTNPAAAAAEQVTYLICGYLYLLSGFGDEPIRWRLSRPAKMVIILLSMPIDTFTGITLLATRTNPWPAYAEQHHTWGPDLVTDVHWAGATMWIGGDTIMIALIVTAMVPWVMGRGRTANRMTWIEQARQAALSRYATVPPGQQGNPSPGRDIDDDQARLDAYNAWLADLADGDKQRTPRRN